MNGVDIDTILLSGLLVVMMLNNIQLLRTNEMLLRHFKTNMRYQLADLKYKQAKSKLLEIEE